MPTCSDFPLNLPFKTFAFDQLFTFCWLINDGSSVLDKQVTSIIIVGVGECLWLPTFVYILFVFRKPAVNADKVNT